MSYGSEKVKNWRRRTKTRMIDAFQGKCGCCGTVRHWKCYDFHHLNKSEKEISIGDLRSNVRAWEDTVIELRKCVMLCKCCHLEVHEGVRDVPTSAPRFAESFLEYKEAARGALLDDCPVCGKSKSIRQMTCSLKCAGTRAWRTDWSKVDLAQLRADGLSWCAIGDRLGVSDCAVHKQAKKQGLK